MAPDVKAFLIELRSHPEILAAARSNPKLYAAIPRLQGGLEELHRSAFDSRHMRALFHEVRREVARDDRTIQQRLFAIGETLRKAKDRTPPRSQH